MSASPRDHNEQPRDVASSTEPIRYPTHNLVAVLDTLEQLRGATRDLMSQGFRASEINIAQGNVAADRLDATTGRGGFAGLALQIAEKLGLQDEELEFKDHYERAMRDGRFVIRIAAPSEERKDRATEILKQHGAHSVAYFGKYTIRGIVRPKAP